MSFIYHLMHFYAGLQSSPHRTHVHTPYVMLPHHNTNFSPFLKILKSVTLMRDVRAPWRWSEWDRNKLECFL